MRLEERRSWTLLNRSEKTESQHVREFTHSSPSSERDRKRDGGPRQREPYGGISHAGVCTPVTTNTATAGGRSGLTRRVSQSQYLGQGQKVPRSPGSPRH